MTTLKQLETGTIMSLLDGLWHSERQQIRFSFDVNNKKKNKWGCVGEGGGT